jgi:DNA-binding transcriptional LysR family regulator
MELRHLRYFAALAEVLHFGRAAAVLQIAQPSLSHQIRQLEEELQTILLERANKRVRLTNAGKAFLEEARQTLAQADRAALTARRASRGELGTLRLGFAHWLDPTRVLASVKAFHARNPAIQIDFQAMSVPLQIAALRDERLDVGFVRPPILETSLSSEMLVREPLVLALSTTHRLAAKERIQLSSLASESFVFIRRETVPIFYDLVLRICRDSGFTPHVPHEADHPQVVLDFVAAGMGISLVPASTRNTKPHGVVLRALRPAPRILEGGIAWRRDNTSPVVNEFLNVVREVQRA